MFSCSAGNTGPQTDHIGCLCHRPAIRALSARIETDLSRRGFIAGVAASVASLGLFGPVRARAAVPPQTRSLFTNFQLFDGKSGALRGGLSLLVDGNKVLKLAEGSPSEPDGAKVVDCGGRTIMPGLIDAHWHSIFAALPVAQLMSSDIGYIFLAAADEAERTLLRGFTTIRDLGGPSFALKQAIEEGLVNGPRIYPCGAMITASGGHGDLRPLSDIPRSFGGPVSALEETGAGAIADGPDQVRLRVREQLLQGASQIKLVGGGGVSSPRTSIDQTTYSEVELRAGVETALDSNTYVAVHAYAPTTVQRAISAGVGCIEHGHLMDEFTASLMAEQGIWLSTQPFVSDEDNVPQTGQSRISHLRVISGTDSLYRLAKAHGIKTAFGTDVLFSAELATRQGIMLTHLTRWYSNPEILKMATATNAQLMALSGLRNPYPDKLGVIEEGALADLIVVDGNPLDDISLVAKPDEKFVLIMKDGRIHKNTLAAPLAARGG
jgi:imidazolonepropionase-like amidohydrolase